MKEELDNHKTKKNIEIDKSKLAQSTLPKLFQDDRVRTFAPPDNNDEFDRLNHLTKASLIPLIENKYLYENISFSNKQPLKKLNPIYMKKMIDDNERDETFKEFYKKESEIASTKIKFFDKKIRDNPTMSIEKINIIFQLKELYEFRGQYFVNKFNNDPEKNKFIDLNSIDNNIYQLEKELRKQEGSGAFTYQNDFVKLLNLLAQLLTKNKSKKLKNDINQILKELYNSKQITKEGYNILNKAITYKNDS